VEVAYALLATCFYLHNAKQHARSNKERVQIVEEVSDDDDSSHEDQEQFGLSFQAPPPLLDVQNYEHIDILQEPYKETAQRFTVRKI
jgi:hypothetical protein